MAPKFVVIYFNSPGNAEPIRWALAQSSLEWEDKRLSQEEFKVLKPTLPNGQVPVLEVDGYLLPQTMAILRYVGKLGGLYPTGDFEAAKCDAVMDSTVDLVIKLLPLIFEQDEAKKTEIRKDLLTNYVPSWLGNMEKQLEQTEGLYFLDKLTVADIAVASRLWWFVSGIFEGVSASIVDTYPKLLALTKSVSAEPKIAEFLAKTKASQ